MKYALRGITAEELTYTINRVKMERNAKFEIKPQFSRTIRRVQENDKLYFVSLEVKVESTEAEPKPFNLKARLVGIFEAEEVNTDEDRQVLAISTTEIVYPYLRSAVSALTANAFAEDARKCLDAGMNAYLAKPLNMEKVIRTIYEQCSYKLNGRQQNKKT